MFFYIIGALVNIVGTALINVKTKLFDKLTNICFKNL